MKGWKYQKGQERGDFDQVPQWTVPRDRFRIRTAGTSRDLGMDHKHVPLSLRASGQKEERREVKVFVALGTQAATSSSPLSFLYPALPEASTLDLVLSLT